MISIIVPVYNGEKFLNRCVKSILAQTDTDFELILVDDGSKDNSGKICDEFAAKDCRVKVIHQKNAGVSAARNAGLDAAAGEYIGFVDVDDYISPATLEIVLKAMKGHDMVMWDAVTVWENGKEESDTIQRLPKSCVIQRENWYPELLMEMAGAVWRCLYRREIVEDVRFPVGIKFSEDRIFNIIAMGKASGLHYIKQGLYYRVMQSESAVHRYHEDYFEACLLAHTGTQTALAENWQDQRYANAYCAQFIGGAFSAINNYCYRTSPLSFRKRMEKTGVVCKNEQLRQAMTVCNYGGLRAWLIKKKMVWALLLLAKASNIKNRR